MSLNYKIAIINPFEGDGVARTLLDGLVQLKKKNNDLNFYLSREFDYDLPLQDYILEENEFIDFSKSADFILLIYGKRTTNYKLAKKIKRWEKTVYIDGSEAGKNRRFDFRIQKKILFGKNREGGINKEMLKRCALYFRREKPYSKGIIPLPFGIESKYLEYYDPKRKKDIDFFCVFGQEEWPLSRRYTRETLEYFCKKNKLSCHTKKTNSREEFYNILSRSKVGISIGGGGFDTLRFWEILANNCLLLTEKIDIYHPDSRKLEYKRILQFSNLYDFYYQLNKIAKFLHTGYKQEDLREEYLDIIKKHSSEARVITVLNMAKNI